MGTVSIYSRAINSLFWKMGAVIGVVRQYHSSPQKCHQSIFPVSSADHNIRLAPQIGAMKRSWLAGAGDLRGVICMLQANSKTSSCLDSVTAPRGREDELLKYRQEGVLV